MSDKKTDDISEDEWLSIVCLHATKEDIDKASDKLIDAEMERLVHGGDIIAALHGYVSGKVEGMTDREIVERSPEIGVDCSDELIDLSIRDIRAEAWVLANAEIEDLRPAIYEQEHSSLCEADTETVLEHYLELQVSDICSSKAKAIEHFIEGNCSGYGDIAAAAKGIGWKG